MKTNKKQSAITKRKEKELILAGVMAQHAKHLAKKKKARIIKLARAYFEYEQT